MKTKLTQMLGIEYPIICGGMAWVGVGDLPAAVSEAGGLGMIGGAMMPAEALRKEIRHTRSKTTKPFGVNVQSQNPELEQVMDVIVEEGVTVVSTGGGDPRPVLERLRGAGVKVMPVVPNLRLAKRMEPLVDGIILEGMEAGGHVGFSTTLAMMSIVLPEITKVPVIMAGGFGDGRGLAAALVMGAAGIQMGTAFLLSEECVTPDTVKKAILEADDNATIVTGHSINDGVRGLKNKFSLGFFEKEMKGASREELIQLGTGAYKLGMMDGDIENGSVSPGIIGAMFTKIRPAGDIVRSIAEEAREVLKNAPSLI